MTRSDEIKDLVDALAKAQAMMSPATKSQMNPHFNKSYAGLLEIREVIKDPFSAYGLAFTQTIAKMDAQWVVETSIYKGNQFISSPTPILPRGTSAQDFGAALTYARRQGLQTLVGIVADEDDDGNEASGKTDLPKKESPRVAPLAAATKSATRGPKPMQGWIATKADLDALMALTMRKNVANQWTKDQVKELMVSKYGKTKLSEFQELEYVELFATVQHKTFSDALGNGPGTFLSQSMGGLDSPVAMPGEGV